MPVAAVNASTTSGASGAEPDSTSRTGPSRSARSSSGSQWAKTGGATGSTLQASSSIRSSTVPAVEPLDQHQLGPVPEHAAEDGVEAVDVEEREHAEHDVVAVDHRRLDPGDLLDVGEQRAVGEHRGARTTRRTARVEQCGELLGVLQRRDRAGLAGEEVVVADLPGSAPVADRHDPGVHGAGDEVLVEHRRVAVERRVHGGHRHAHGGQGLRVRDDEARAGVGDHPGELVGGGARVDRHRDHLGPQDPEVAGDELETVADHDHHPVAGQDPEATEAGGAVRDLGLEPAPGHRAPTGLDDREAVGRVLGGLGDQVRKVRQRHGSILPHLHTDPAPITGRSAGRPRRSGLP